MSRAVRARVMTFALVLVTSLATNVTASADEDGRETCAEARVVAAESQPGPIVHKGASVSAGASTGQTEVVVVLTPDLCVPEFARPTTSGAGSVLSTNATTGAAPLTP